MMAAMVLAACSSAEPGSQPAGGAGSASATPTLEILERYALQQSLDFTITLTTTAIGGTFARLDRKHSCERGDTSPDLAWDGVPEGAESLALVMEDPASDVYGLTIDVLWAHWVVYSIPSDVTELEPAQEAGDVLGNGARQGSNDYERVQYNGPCPIPRLTFPQDRSCNSCVPVLPGATREETLAQLESQQIQAEDRPYYLRLYALDISVDLPSGASRDTLLEAIDGHVVAAGELAVSYKSTKGVRCRTADADVCLGTVRR